MYRTLRHMAGAIAVLTLVSVGFTLSAANPMRALAACTIPSPPANDELTANPDGSISIVLVGSAGATSYNIYRGTTSGGEAATPVANTTSVLYTDKGLTANTDYFYEFTAVNSCGESAKGAEDSSKTTPPAPTGGNVAGVASGNSEIYYGENAMFGGEDWFQTLTGWFPQNLGSSGSNSPGQQVVDMAYATLGSMTFNNVVVPTSGLYTIEWRYAFQGGLFPSVNNRQMGVAINGTVLTTTERFPITGSFDVYQDSSLQAHLNAGRNSVTLFAVTDHGVSRVDQLIVTPATASVPSGPTNLTVTPGAAGATLKWTASTSGSPTSYSIFRGTATDGEATTAVGTVSGTTTTFTDTGLTNGKTYFYNVAANNATGVGPDSNEVSVSPGVTTTTPAAAPSGVTLNPANFTLTPASNVMNLTWNPVAGATSYNIYRGTAPGGEAATPVGTSTSDSYTDTGVTDGTGYYYTVAAVNAGGTGPKSAETNSVPSALVVTPPVPFGMVVTTASGQINLQWTYEENATSYKIYRSTTSGGEGATPIATTTSSSYTDTSVTAGTTYYYEVTALTGTTESVRSPEVSANTSGTSTPPTPVGLVATAGNGSVALSWTASTGATSYSIYRGTTSGGEGTTSIATTTTNSYTNTGLTNGTTYYYKVSATNSAGTSAQSGEASATPTSSPTSSLQISAGGPATGTWVADEDFTGGATSDTTHAITTTGLTNPAPQSVYQHNRYGNFTYTVPGLTAGGSYTVRLHFAEEYWTAAGSRTFNVLINGTQVLTNFDIFATAGGEYIGVIEPFTATASSTGTITIQFVTVKDNAQVNGIEILSG
jgi:fibronectin type 3 domain-containing protein